MKSLVNYFGYPEYKSTFVINTIIDNNAKIAMFTIICSSCYHKYIFLVNVYLKNSGVEIGSYNVTCPWCNLECVYNQTNNLC